MANIALQRTFKVLTELFPERYKYAENLIDDFGKSDSTRNHAWSVLPGIALGKLPDVLYDHVPSYSKAMSVYKRHGKDGIAYLLTATTYSEYFENYTRLMRGDAISNFALIVGREPVGYEISSIKVWKPFTTGKSLFIPGLGSFDVRAIIATMETRNRAEGYWRSTIDPYRIRALGYFNSDDRHLEYVMAMKPTDPILAHVIKYRQKWTVELLGHMDVVRQMFDDTGIMPAQPPERVCALADEWRLAHDVKQAAARNDTSPFKLTGISDIYAGDYTLSQVTSPQEMKGIGMHLDNCVGSYVADVRIGKMQIWGCYKDRELLGVGGINLKGKGAKVWTQLRGYRNGLLPADVLEVYYAALNTILESL